MLYSICTYQIRCRNKGHNKRKPLLNNCWGKYYWNWYPFSLYWFLQYLCMYLYSWKHTILEDLFTENLFYYHYTRSVSSKMKNKIEGGKWKIHKFFSTTTTRGVNIVLASRWNWTGKSLSIEMITKIWNFWWSESVTKWAFQFVIFSPFVKWKKDK